MFGQLIDIMNCQVGKKFAKQKNNLEFMNWFNLLERYAQYRYEFEGLPETVNERVLKQALIWYGSCSFFEKDDNLICLPARATQDFNVYGDPMFAWVYGRNGYNERISLYISGQDESKFVTKGINTPPHKGKGVFVRENYKMYPFMNYVYNYAWKMADASRTLSTCAFHYKRPYLISAKEEVVPTVKRYFEKTAENEEYVVSTGIFDAQDVAAVPLGLPAGALNDVEQLCDYYLNQFLTLCGLDNNQQIHKSERVNTLEVEANDESISNNIDPMVEYLQEQIDFVNKIYGTSIQVKKQVEEEEDEQDILGSDNGENGTGSVQRNSTDR